MDSAISTSGLQQFLRTPRNWLAAGTCFMIVATFMTLDRSSAGRTLSSFGRPSAYNSLDFEKLLRDIHQPLIPSFDDSSWEDAHGRNFTLERTLYDKPLGNDVLILDVESRLGSRTKFRNKVKLGLPGWLEFDKLDYISAGLLNHYMYAVTHGYDYQIIQPDYDINMYATWYKVPAIRRALETHRFVVFLDADALFRYLELPLEWLLNHWDIDERTAFAMAPDPTHIDGDWKNWDVWRKRPNLNTGVVIAQRHELTDDLFTAWMECPEGRRYEQCEHFRWEPRHEQGAFASFVRYDKRFNDDRLIKPIPCNEANGYPTHPGCKGHLIEHNWDRKNKLPNLVAQQVARIMLGRLHDTYKDNEAELKTVVSDVPKEWANLTA